MIYAHRQKEACCVCTLAYHHGKVGRIIKLQPQIVGQNKTKACGGNNLTCGLFQVEGGFDVCISFLKALELLPFWLKLLSNDINSFFPLGIEASLSPPYRSSSSCPPCTSAADDRRRAPWQGPPSPPQPIAGGTSMAAWRRCGGRVDTPPTPPRAYAS